MSSSTDTRAFSAHPHGWTYAVPGVISWIVVLCAAVGLFFFPDRWASVATFFVGYLMLRMMLIVTFAIVGDVRRRFWERRDWTEGDTLPGPAGFSPADVHHVVLVPNYKEPLDVLERTVGALAVQHRAKERVVAVLCMEEREPGAREKGEALAARYADRFERVIVTVHPADVPGELACKASNQTYAAAIARDIVTGELGVPLDRITVTSCDADSVIHPKYFAAVSRMFAADERRYARFWQAPHASTTTTSGRCAPPSATRPGSSTPLTWPSSRCRSTTRSPSPPTPCR